MKFKFYSLFIALNRRSIGNVFLPAELTDSRRRWKYKIDVWIIVHCLPVDNLSSKVSSSSCVERRI